MKHNLTLLFFLLTIFLVGQSQIKADLYYSSQDYFNDAFSHEHVQVHVKEISDHHIYVKDIKSKSGKKIWQSKDAWAIYYEDNLYVNLRYAKSSNKRDIFLKMHIFSDEYVAVVIDDNLPRNLRKFTIGGARGIGLISPANYLMNDAFANSKPKFRNEDGTGGDILIADYKDLKVQSKSKKGNVRLKYLKQKNICKILELDKSELPKPLTLDAAIELIENTFESEQ